METVSFINVRAFCIRAQDRTPIRCCRDVMSHCCGARERRLGIARIPPGWRFRVLGCGDWFCSTKSVPLGSFTLDVRREQIGDSILVANDPKVLDGCRLRAAIVW